MTTSLETTLAKSSFFTNSMNEFQSKNAEEVVLMLQHPMTIYKSDLCRILGYTRFSQLFPFFKIFIFQNLPNRRNWLNIKQFDESETRIIFAILAREGRITQTKIDNYAADNVHFKLETTTEIIIKKRKKQISKNLWIYGQ